MKQDLKIILSIIGIVVALVIIFQVKACIKEQNTVKISKLEGELAALKVEAAKDKIELIQLKKETDAERAILEGAISELTVKTEAYKSEIKTKDLELADLKTEYFSIDEEDKDGKIVNLEKQVMNLEDQLGKALKGWDAAEAKAKGWELALKKQDEYCVKLEKQLGISENLVKIAASVDVKKDKQIARLKLGKTVERIITVPLAIYGGFKIGQTIFGVK